MGCCVTSLANQKQAQITSALNTSNIIGDIKTVKDFKITGYELNDSGTINKYDSSITGDLVKNTKNTKINFIFSKIMIL